MGRSEDLVGRIRDSVHRVQAVDVMKEGGTVQMICGPGEKGVASIFFDVSSTEAVEKVVMMKTSEAKKRRALFGLMTPADFYREVAELRYSPRLENLNEAPCFLLTPVRANARIPKAATSFEGGLTYALCFVSDSLAYFSDMVILARSRGVEVGGTSQNITGGGNTRDIDKALEFFENSPDPKMWLVTGNRLTGDSFPILKLNQEKPEAKLIRQGSSDYMLACSLLGLTPVPEG